MKTKKLISVEQNVVNELMDKYPDKTFTDIVGMGLELLLEAEDPNSIQHIQTLVFEFNKLKKSYREYKDEVDNRLITLETRLK
jgi:uncharacterized membrane protein